MKESVSVAKTVAWNWLSESTKASLHARSKENGFGLRINCPDGGTPKNVRILVVYSNSFQPYINRVAPTVRN